MLTVLLTAPPYVQTTGYTELNGTGYVVSELTQRMGRASTCRFRLAAGLGDDAALAARTPVKFTIDGVCVFAGKVLPATRSIGASADQLEYAAADVLEFLAYNPCAEVNQYYNRDTNDTNLVPYPTDTTWVSIVQTEFAPIVGSGRLVGALDFSDVPSATRSLVPPNFQVKGKTWLAILEAIASEIPVIAWYYDPSTCPSNSVEGGTLRFYDISKSPVSPVSVYLADVTGSRPAAANVESVDVTEDISQSIDTLVMNGWGLMRERIELAKQAWVAASAGLFSQVGGDVYLVRNDQVYQTSDPLWDPSDPDAYPNNVPAPKWFNDKISLGGIPPYRWQTLNAAANRPWFPDSNLSQARMAYRRYKVGHEIVDLRLLKDASSPPKYTRADQSMWVMALNTIWNAGDLTFTIDGNFYEGLFLNGVKFGIFTNGLQDDYGTASINFAAYPNYPHEPMRKINIGPPQGFERNYFVVATPLCIKTSYAFASVLPSAPDAEDYRYLPDASGRSADAYWPYGSSSFSAVWLRYTGRDPLIVTKTDASLGYAKKVVLWDQRFFKYYSIKGELLRDDTAMLDKYATMLFALLSRKRVYGTLTLAVPAASQASYPIGSFVSVVGWRGGTKTFAARVQERNLADLVDRGSLRLTFDTPAGFSYLESSVAFRQYFYTNEVRGTASPSSGGGFSAFGAGGGGTTKPVEPPPIVDPFNPGGSGFGPGGGMGPGAGGAGGGGWGGNCCDPPTKKPPAGSS